MQTLPAAEPTERPPLNEIVEPQLVEAPPTGIEDCLPRKSVTMVLSMPFKNRTQSCALKPEEVKAMQIKETVNKDENFEVKEITANF